MSYSYIVIELKYHYYGLVTLRQIAITPNEPNTITPNAIATLPNYLRHSHRGFKLKHVGGFAPPPTPQVNKPHDPLLYTPHTLKTLIPNFIAIATASYLLTLRNSIGRNGIGEMAFGATSTRHYLLRVYAILSYIKLLTLRVSSAIDSRKSYCTKYILVYQRVILNYLF